MKPNYDALALMPYVIAETVAGMTYTGREWSEQHRDPSRIEKIEAKRQKMTEAQIREFADHCDARCRNAYEKDAEWFMKCVKAKGNIGRSQLYVWTSHWLAAFLNAPKRVEPLEFTIYDFTTRTPVTIEIVPDSFGFVVGIKGTEDQSIVFDANEGKLLIAKSLPNTDIDRLATLEYPQLVDA